MTCWHMVVVPKTWKLLVPIPNIALATFDCLMHALKFVRNQRKHPTMMCQKQWQYCRRVVSPTGAATNDAVHAQGDYDDEFKSLHQ